MKSIRVHNFGEPSVLKLEELPDPVAGPGQAVLKIHAIGVNPVETYIRAGKYGPRPFPFTPGSDAAGVIESVGGGATDLKAGDRVYAHATLTGAYASKALCTFAQLHPLPTTATFAHGAAIGVPYATAHRAIFLRGRALAGETVLIHGASGGVGIAAIQFCRMLGLTLIGTAGSDRGMKLAAAQGAHHVLNHHDANYLQQIMALSNGRGVDLILEMAAHTNLGKDLPLLAKQGRVVVIGSRGPVEITPRETMARDADIRGMTLMNATEAELHRIHAAIGAGLESGALRPVIARELPLDQAAAAHVAILEPGAYGKIVLVS